MAGKSTVLVTGLGPPSITRLQEDFHAQHAADRAHAPQPAAIIRRTVPRQEIQNVMSPGYPELMASVGAQDIAPAGPWFTHPLRMSPDTFDFAIGVPITVPITPVGRVTAMQLPAATVARTLFYGACDGLMGAWTEFNAWIAGEGYTPGPDLWECYVAWPESSPEQQTGAPSSTGH